MRRIKVLTPFLRFFWASALFPAALLLAWLHLWWSSHPVPLLPKPPFPVPDKAYVACYQRSRLEHGILDFGLFGMGEKMRRSDLFVLGSSHCMYGLSAARIAERLSSEAGRSVRTFNLGGGYGEGAPFAYEVLRRNGVRDKLVILDLCAPLKDGLSGYEQLVLQMNRLGVYAQVFETWIEFSRDWVLDSVLPQFAIQDRFRHGITAQRPLAYYDLKRWDTNDSCEIWSPTRGFVYRENSTEGFSLPIGTGMAFPWDSHDDLYLSQDGSRNLESLGMRLILTAVPYAGMDAAYAAKIAADNDCPFVPIAPDQLTFFDNNHLSAAAKRVATDRLLDGISALGIHF